MRTAALWTAVVAVAALACGVADAKSGKSEDGYCKDDTTCQKTVKDYTCVSVQTTRENTEEVKQCLPYKVAGDVCAGVMPGLCPSFSTWSKEFKSISSVCAYIIPTSKCAADPTANSTKGTVTCLNVSSTDGDRYGVIYGCVDYDGQKLLFESGSKSAKLSQAFNYSAIISEGCVNPKNAVNSDVVCSGRGTCGPNAAGQMDYKCLCNVGYSGKYCQKIDSNKCTQKAQCAAGTCNLVTQQCECDAGTTGFQCAECDPKSTSACSKHGTCGTPSPGTVSAATRRFLASMASGSGDKDDSSPTVGSTNNSSSTSTGNVCVCEPGYAGSQCDRKVAGKQSTSASNSTEAPPPASAASSTLFTSVAFVSVLVLAVLN
ncbi:hypothetical protein PybrP1_007449 [[Pythium] brassicae (nom. inval.)]|nr:hypothetical protein PybrP1_007449 [[Pythium] brassicae (nom. inval.)]